MTIELQRSPMPSYSWLRMTRAISMGKTFASTVGFLHRTPLFQESLYERCCLSHRWYFCRQCPRCIFVSRVEVNVVVYRCISSASRPRVVTKLNIRAVVLSRSFIAQPTKSHQGRTLATGPLNPQETQSRRGAEMQIHHQARRIPSEEYKVDRSRIMSE